MIVITTIIQWQTAMHHALGPTMSDDWSQPPDLGKSRADRRKGCSGRHTLGFGMEDFQRAHFGADSHDDLRRACTTPCYTIFPVSHSQARSITLRLSHRGPGQWHHCTTNFASLGSQRLGFAFHALVRRSRFSDYNVRSSDNLSASAPYLRSRNQQHRTEVLSKYSKPVLDGVSSTGGGWRREDSYFLVFWFVYG